MNADVALGEGRTVPRRIEKPWGYELIWAETESYAGKILHVAAGHQLSFQYHRYKDETLYVLTGDVELDIACGDEPAQTFALVAGESFRVRPGVRHRIRALTTSNLLEASTPQLDDVIRLQDDYGRVEC